VSGLRDGEGLPRFVEQEFRDFLQCGWLAGGFARFRCGDCSLDRLVPFSCKGRALRPSCGGRRMAERAAHLLEHGFPDSSLQCSELTGGEGTRVLLTKSREELFGCPIRFGLDPGHHMRPRGLIFAAEGPPIDLMDSSSSL
jgi:hypothetical protein